MRIAAAAFLLFLVMDPLGNIPLLLVLIDRVKPRRQVITFVRESLIALAVLIVFQFAGRSILALLGISESALGVAGGVVLFLIAIRMIFPRKGEGAMFGATPEGEPFIVPIAIPLIAGPSAMATVMLLASQAGEQLETLQLSAAIAAAWVVSTGLIVAALALRRFIRPRGLIAMERLMGMVLMTVSVQMLLDGIRTAFGGLTLS
ncbi:NAAT family transporter [Candidatus Bipolaricaulota bacterium]|nr:NAAT family transporter [Candidatus Bipolaricaulota bacterium]